LPLFHALAYFSNRRDLGFQGVDIGRDVDSLMLEIPVQPFQGIRDHFRWQILHLGQVLKCPQVGIRDFVESQCAYAHIDVSLS
jgi:hypothetical protein